MKFKLKKGIETEKLNRKPEEKQTKNGCEKHNRKRRKTRWKLPDAKPGRSHGIAAQVNSSLASQPVSFNWALAQPFTAINNKAEYLN